MANAALNRKFDRIRALEEAGQNTTRSGGRAMRKLLGNPLAVAGLVIFTVILLASIFAPLLTPHDPQKIDLRAMLQSPSAEHWFGTDRTGRDVFARILYGGRVSILVGLGSALIAAVIGVVCLFYSVFGMNRRTAVPYTIHAVNAPDRATEVVLKPTGQMLDFKPGQFAFVEIDGKDWNEPRPFTISSAPGEGHLRFTMKVLGTGPARCAKNCSPAAKFWCAARTAASMRPGSAAKSKSGWQVALA